MNSYKKQQMIPRIVFFTAVGLAIISAYWLGYFHPEPAVRQSPNDNKAYQAYQLDNGLRVLLISDPQTDQAAAALDVAVGSTADPEDFLGLAHFTEHMLFLGTQSFPEVGEYQEYISRHGGSHNAFTSPEHTNYFFSIKKDHLHQALERFAGFFYEPLLLEEYVEREKNAVHAEYSSKLTDDFRRAYSVLKANLNPAHPLAKFSVGNLETLADKPDLSARQAMQEFYQEYYSANLMTLVVLGAEPLGQLKTWTDELFNNISGHSASRPSTEEPLFSPESLPKRIDLVPEKNIRRLALNFPVPNTQPHYRSKPANYLSNLLGHEGEGSLFAQLKAAGLAESLSAGIGLGALNERLLSININLTEAGLQQIDEITEQFFQYVALIKQNGIEAWRYQEQAKLAELAFQYQESSDPIGLVSRLANNMQYYPLEDTIYGDYLMADYQPALIHQYLDLVQPSNLLQVVTAKGLATDSESRWYQAPYQVQEITESKLVRWQDAVVAAPLALPLENLFIPEDTELKPLADRTAQLPELVVEQPSLGIWFLQEPNFRVPKSSLYLSLRSPQANSSAKQAVATGLLTDLINDSLNEFSYPAYLAGLSYQLYTHSRGISIKINGYQDKQPMLLEKILQRLTQPEIQPERFAIRLNQRREALENARKDKAYNQTIQETKRTLVTDAWTIEEQLVAIAELSLEDLLAQQQQLFASLEIQALMHGNNEPAEAEALAQLLGEYFSAEQLSAQVPQPRVYRLNNTEVLVQDLALAQNDSAVSVFIQGQQAGFESRAYFGLAGHMLSSPFYHQLRTEQQLGYIVFASPYPMFNVPGLLFVVQSPSADPLSIHTQIEGFIAAYPKTLAQMPAEEFERYKTGLIARLEEKPNKLAEFSDRLWRDLGDGHYGFDSRQQIVEHIKTISQADFIEFYRTNVQFPAGPRLLVQSQGNQQTNASDPQRQALGSAFQYRSIEATDLRDKAVTF